MTLTTSQKKDVERLYAHKAARALGEKWEIIDIPEPLDFIIRTPGGGTFGLEIMELFDDQGPSGSPLKLIEANQRSIMRSVIEGYYAAGGHPIRVNFVGSLSDPDNIIASLLRESQGAGADEISIAAQEGIPKMLVLPLPADQEQFQNYARWQIAEAGFVRVLSIETLENRIAKKAARLSSYQQKAHETDLLLVINRATASGRFLITEDLEVDSQGFRRIFVLTYPNEIQQIA